MTQHCAGRSCARCGLRRQRTPEGWLYKVSVPAWANTDGRVEPAWYTVWVQAPAHVKPVDSISYDGVPIERLEPC
ncbi:hypothetical protein ACFRH4_42260 [Streptomyces mirabilis]|uniref:hypothetical protein n=1 Tax=Streptomyces mirabilis TaxID=68239 RepID=UPI0036C83050